MLAPKLKNVLYSRRNLPYFIFLYLSFLGLYNYVLHEPRNDCEMTFMFQTPEFISIPLKPNVTKKYPNYSLFVYGEGAYAQSWQYPKMENSLTGIPVLFVPGNGGSYKQVRSFGSISLRMADDLIAPFNFDFFTINFNEELSALSGQMLRGQTEFLYESIEAIKQLYMRVGRNVSLVVIGHSVGGLLSRAVFSFSEFSPYSVDLLITLASPHQKPVLPIDSASVDFYTEVNNNWDKIRERLSHLTVISIGGGIRDKLVRSHLIQLPTVSLEERDLSVVTTHIPDVWVSVDHLCIVWCRQLIIKLVRLLYDLVPKDGSKITRDMILRKNIVRYHLVERTREKTYPSYFIPKNINIPMVNHYVNALSRFFDFRKNKIIESHQVMIPLVNGTFVVVITNGVQKLDWIIACNASIYRENNTEKHICEKGVNLSTAARIIPGSPERKFFLRKADQLMEDGSNHLLVYLSPSATKVSVYTERFIDDRRTKEIIMPSLLSSLFSHTTVLDIPVTEESMFYNLTLLGIEQTWHTYLLKLEVLSCYPTASEKAYLHFSVPWSYEDHFSSVRAKKSFYLHAITKLNVPKPSPDAGQARLQLTLDPYCGYRLTTKLSFPDAVGQVYRHYYPIILPFAYAILLSVLSQQIQPTQAAAFPGAEVLEDIIGKRRIFISVAVILRDNFLSVSVYGLLPTSPFLVSIFFKCFLNDPHFNKYIPIFSEINLTFTQQIFLSWFLFLTSYCVMYLCAIIIVVILELIVKVIWLTSRRLCKNETVNPSSQTSLRSGKLPVLIFIVSFGVSLFSCSTIGYLIAILLSFIHLVVVCFQSFKFEQRQGPTIESTKFIVYLTIFLIMILSTVPSIPSAIIWFNRHIPESPASMSFDGTFKNIDESLLLVVLSIFWEPSAPFMQNRLAAIVLSVVLKTFSVLSVIICSYNYSYISAFNVIAFTLYNSVQFVCFCCTRKRLKAE